MIWVSGLLAYYFSEYIRTIFHDDVILHTRTLTWEADED